MAESIEEVRARYRDVVLPPLGPKPIDVTVLIADSIARFAQRMRADG